MRTPILMQLFVSPIVRVFVSRRRVTQTIGIAILIVIVWWNVSAMFVTQQQVYSCLDETFTEFRNMRSAEIDDDAWNRFRQRSLAKLSSFVPRLEQEADVSDPASLSLLAVSRDYLPALLKEQSRSSTDMEYKIRTHLEVARRAISQGTAPGVTTDFWTLLFVSLNLGLVSGAVWFIAQKFLFRATLAR
jgi:hypothetical protein